MSGPYTTLRGAGQPGDGFGHGVGHYQVGVVGQYNLFQFGKLQELGLEVQRFDVNNCISNGNSQETPPELSRNRPPATR